LRTTYAPDERLQCDPWFPPLTIPVGFGQVARLQVLTMTSGYSHLPAIFMISSQLVQALVSGHSDMFTAWQAIPKTLVWDGEAALS